MIASACCAVSILASQPDVSVPVKSKLEEAINRRVTFAFSFLNTTVSSTSSRWFGVGASSCSAMRVCPRLSGKKPTSGGGLGVSLSLRSGTKYAARCRQTLHHEVLSSDWDAVCTCWPAMQLESTGGTGWYPAMSQLLRLSKSTLSE